MQSDIKKLIKKHQQLTHSDELIIESHNQREKDDWYINSVMVKNCEIPFKFRRRQQYKQLLKGQRVNLTYYPAKETVAGLDFDYMKVVRIKLS